MSVLLTCIKDVCFSQFVLLSSPMPLQLPVSMPICPSIIISHLQPSLEPWEYMIISNLTSGAAASHTVSLISTSISSYDPFIKNLQGEYFQFPFLSISAIFAINKPKCQCNVWAIAACVTFMFIVCFGNDYAIKSNETHMNPCGKGGEESIRKAYTLKLVFSWAQLSTRL